MIVIPRDRKIEDQLRSLRPPNVRLLEWVPFARMPLVFRDGLESGDTRVWSSVVP